MMALSPIPVTGYHPLLAFLLMAFSPIPVTGYHPLLAFSIDGI
jgi:hypothetical protein